MLFVVLLAAALVLIILGIACMGSVCCIETVSALRDSMVDLREDVRELRRNLEGYLIEDEKVLPGEEIDEGIVIRAANWSAAELERMYELK